MKETKELIWYYDNGEIVVHSRSEYDFPDEEENCIKVEFSLVVHEEQDYCGKMYYLKGLDWDEEKHTDEENKIIDKYTWGNECQEICERLYKDMLDYQLESLLPDELVNFGGNVSR